MFYFYRSITSIFSFVFKIIIYIRKLLGKEDKSRFRLHYDPNHPAANENGYVKMPNVNSLIEMFDMREAQRLYQANLNMVDSSRSMIMATIDLLR